MAKLQRRHGGDLSKLSSSDLEDGSLGLLGSKSVMWLIFLSLKVVLFNATIFGIIAGLDVAGFRWWCSKPIKWGQVYLMCSGMAIVVYCVASLTAHLVGQFAPLEYAAVITGWECALTFATVCISINTWFEPIVARTIEGRMEFCDPTVNKLCHSITASLGVIGFGHVFRHIARSAMVAWTPNGASAKFERDGRAVDARLFSLLNKPVLRMHRPLRIAELRYIVNGMEIPLSGVSQTSRSSCRGTQDATPVDSTIMELAGQIVAIGCNGYAHSDGGPDAELLLANAALTSPYGKVVAEARGAGDSGAEAREALLDEVTTELTDRSILERSLQSHSSSDAIFTSMFDIVYWPVVSIFVLQLFHVELAVLYEHLVAVGVVVGLATKDYFGDMLSTVWLVLDRKPYSVGDFLVVDGHSGWLMVDRIRRWDTVFFGLEGEAVYMTNAHMAKCKIINMNRSAERWLDTFWNISRKVTQEQLRELERRLNAWMKPRPWFQGTVVLDVFSAHEEQRFGGSDWWRLYVGASLKCTWQQRRVWIRNRADFLFFISDFFKSLDIENYFSPHKMDFGTFQSVHGFGVGKSSDTDRMF